MAYYINWFSLSFIMTAQEQGLRKNKNDKQYGKIKIVTRKIELFYKHCGKSWDVSHITKMFSHPRFQILLLFPPPDVFKADNKNYIR